MPYQEVGSITAMDQNTLQYMRLTVPVAPESHMFCCHQQFCMYCTQCFDCYKSYSVDLQQAEGTSQGLLYMHTVSAAAAAPVCSAEWTGQHF